MKGKIVLIGGGGHCRACIDVIEAEGRFSIAGIIDAGIGTGEKILGYPVIGTDENIPEAISRYTNVLVTVGQVKTAETRKRLHSLAQRHGARFPVVVSPKALVSGHAFLNEGSIIMHGAVINAGAAVGCNCIINTAAVIEHDVRVGDHCHISTACVVNGGCILGNDVFVGSNSVVSNNVTLADSVIIGAGSVIIKSIDRPGIYAGNPAEKIG